MTGITFVSPEDAAELENLRAFTRELLDDVERDLGTKLGSVAVDHWNTDNPHFHVLIRGRTDDGEDVPARIGLEAHPPTLQQMEDRQADDEGESDIPHGESCRNNCHKPLALIFAEVARAERKLRARQEQDDTQYLTRDTEMIPTEPLKNRASRISKVPRMMTAPPVCAPKRT
jgi:hypothetical protein